MKLYKIKTCTLINTFRQFLPRFEFLGNLADLEEISPSLGRPHCTKLYEEAIIVNKKLFDNHHVYPYTYQGGYFYRAKKFKEAIESWSNAADVIRL